MADEGLLLGLAEGIKSAYGAYNDERDRSMRIQNYVIDRKMKKAAMDLQAKEKGMTYNDETGDLAPDLDPNNPYNRKLKKDAFDDEAGLLSKGLIKDPVTGKPAYSPEKKEEMDVDLNYKKSQTKKLKEDIQNPKRTDPELKAATDLRKEYQGRPEVKSFNTVSTAFKKIQKSANDPSAAGDLNLITSYMKMLDPDTGVKEGEFANAQNAAGVPERIRNSYNQMLSGERLGQNQRNDFLKQAQNLYNSHLSSKEEIDSEFEDLSKRYKVDSGLIKTKTKEVERNVGGFPRQVRMGNQMATVKNAKELEEAVAEGFE